MKLYYYAFTGHKYGLDRMRRGAVILNKLRDRGIDTMLLVNDFRAGLVARDFGVPESVNIEGIQDIDAIAQTGDCVIIDSPEDDHGRLVKYCSDFKTVFRFAETPEDKSIHGEIMFKFNCDNDKCISSFIVDDIYYKKHQKKERTLFFLGDSDADKTILDNTEFFKDSDMELLLGSYFYVKYESDLEKIFGTIHESEEYIDLICTSSSVVTVSFQTALEASVAGAEVIFIELEKLSSDKREILSKLNVILIINFNYIEYKHALLKNVSTVTTTIEENETVIEKIINKL